MIDFIINWPPDFSDYAWEVEAKGWCSGVSVKFGEHQVALTFYDPIRLQQDISEDLNSQGYFAESNLVVVNKITLESMQQAIHRLVDSGAILALTGLEKNESVSIAHVDPNSPRRSD